MVRLNFDKSTVEVWLRKYDNKGGGWIPNTIHGKTDNNGLWLLDNLEFMSPLSSSSPPIPTPQIEPPATAFTQTITEVPTPLKEPKTPPLTDPESRGVFGRKNEITRISKELTENAIFTIYGLPGIGKSELIGEICRTETHKKCKYLRLRINAGLKLIDLYQELAPILGTHNEELPSLSETVSKIDFSFLARFTPEPTIIHLEQAHELFTNSQFQRPEIGHFLLAIATNLPQIRIILESREAPPRDLFPNFHKATMLNGLRQEAMRAYFRRPFKDYPEKGFELSENEAAEVFRRLGGDIQRGRAHPLAMFLLATVADGRQETPIQVLQRHQAVLVDELEQKLFIELYDHVLSTPARRILRLCALYRDGIPDAHADRLNDRVQDADAFDQLIRRCLLTPNESAEWYYLHRLLGDLTDLRISQDRFEESLTNHEYIADTWLLQIKFKTRPSLPNIRAASEAAYHFIQAKCFDRLTELSDRFLRGDILPHLEAASSELHRAHRYEENKLILELLVVIEPTNHKAHRFLGEALERLNGEGDETALKHSECLITFVLM